MDIGKRGRGEVSGASMLRERSSRCEAVLSKPPPCYDFRGMRAYVLCKAWDIMEKEKRSRLPVGEAWREARKVCQKE